MSVSLRDTAVPPDTPGAPDFSITNVVPPAPVEKAPAPTPPPGKLFGRLWALAVGTPTDAGGGGKAVNLSDFHIEFSVETGMMLVPWKLTATVTNVPDDLAQQITQEFTNVTLMGGYQHARYGQLFAGDVVFFEKGKLNATDTFLRIHAAVADAGIHQPLLNKRLPPGYTGMDVINAVNSAMGPYGVTLGTITQIDAIQNQKSTRSRTLYGLPPEVMRDLTQAIDGFCFIDADKKLHVLGPGEKLPAKPIEINILNGMVNIPTQQIGAAIHVQCLLNYQITPGCQIKINNDEVNKVIKAQGGDTSPAINQTYPLQMTARIEDDGIYVAWTVTHRGDNRGQSWYTEISTMPLDPDQAGPKAPG